MPVIINDGLPLLLIWKVWVLVGFAAPLLERTLPKSTSGGESGDTVIWGAACAIPLPPTQSTKSNSPIQRVDINKLRRASPREPRRRLALDPTMPATPRKVTRRGGLAVCVGELAVAPTFAQVGQLLA